MKAHQKGLHTYRFAQNPDEKIAAEMWAAMHPDRNGRTGVLPYLLGDGRDPDYPSDRDWLVAATLIQWLGSPVGAGFLRDFEERKAKCKAKG